MAQTWFISFGGTIGRIAITAAVVGVIASVALLFNYHVFRHDGYAGRLEWTAAVLAVAVATAIFHFNANVIPVVLVGGLAGMAIKFPV